ncbi:ABC transporter substrate-binding protein [Maribacter polysiphoniae]|uniref:ABC transporter substrate-binding protein n=1 Tax=Maribacter polysiphoniae TaxID=429344 RepID=A0A316EKC7_9FLAO|nr:substrate-binding domain-containing protein [Maribacter polysiphoniae]MBD1261348.1 ABC transporter substrate-binding protein [Maribacter polysiphoniae]PWK23410.1 ABC-type nitrate/sulfonate/bicarbonate transport system substrate-binding protein [Maribacter polysiphoniae]
MKKVKIIGVPEHFNMPWHLAIEEGAFEERGIELEWTDIPEGTGKMCQMLENQETDLAIILTEGLIKSITEGNPAKIVQEYIASPLHWGIHVGAKSTYNSIDDLMGRKVAISRFGSGSHLMAYVNAQNEGWDTQNLQFEVINNLDGAVEALTKGTADYFMWEHFTTKPLVDQQVFRRLGDCPTPWPCFVIAATDSFIQDNASTLEHILEIINMYTADFKQIPSIDRTLANRYGQQLEDIQEWMSMTRWSQSQLKPQTVEKVQDTLMDLKLIVKQKPYTDIAFSKG